MIAALPEIPGTHAVHFYESERFLERAIAAFLADGARLGRPLAVISRPRLFDAVAHRLASGADGPALDLTGRVNFVDVNAALENLMPAGQLDHERLEAAFTKLLAEAGPISEERPLWCFGELSEELCRRGNRQTAIEVETRWHALTAGRRPIVTLCAYAMERFDDDLGADALRLICGQHTHVLPTERIAEGPDEHARFERVALLELRARVLDRSRDGEPQPASPEFSAPTVYIIDDDASVRRSLGRLIASVNMPVRTFDSAEAFLSEVDQSSSGCLILDVQMLGMSGLDLQRRLSGVRDRWPIIAMSGAFDPQIEQDALSLGAVAFLRKPFVAQALLEAIANARCVSAE